MDLQSAGRSKRNPTSASVRSTQAQREYRAIPPGEIVYDLEHPEPRPIWRKILLHISLWVSSLTLFLVGMVREVDWIISAGFFVGGFSVILLAREARWERSTTRTTPEG